MASTICQKQWGKQLCVLPSNSIEYFRNRFVFRFCYLIKNLKCWLFIRTICKFMKCHICCALWARIAFIKICNIYFLFIFSKISSTHSFQKKGSLLGFFPDLFDVPLFVWNWILHAKRKFVIYLTRVFCCLLWHIIKHGIYRGLEEWKNEREEMCLSSNEDLILWL